MRFSELVKESILLLKESERLTYRALQREFDIDAETLEDLKIELIKARKVASPIPLRIRAPQLAMKSRGGQDARA